MLALRDKRMTRGQIKTWQVSLQPEIGHFTSFHLFDSTISWLPRTGHLGKRGGVGGEHGLGEPVSYHLRSPVQPVCRVVSHYHITTQLLITQLIVIFREQVRFNYIIYRAHALGWALALGERRAFPNGDD